MIESGESGVDRGVLEKFLEGLPDIDGVGLFPERFTLEVRVRGGRHLLHVNRHRGVVRPVIPEDSRKTLISIPRSYFVRLVENGKPAHWRKALKGGVIRVE